MTTLKWLGHDLCIEPNRIACLTDASVLVRHGKTVVLATVVVDAKLKENLDFIPLTVHYIEKYYAAQKIPGVYGKREGRPQDHEVLMARLIDRSIRPLLPSGLQNEVELTLTVLSYDAQVGTEAAAFIAASSALSISSVPFKGPLAAMRVCVTQDGAFHYAPNASTVLNLFVTGSADKVIMLEGEGKEVPAKVLLQAVQHAMKQYKPVLNAIAALKKNIKTPVSVLETDMTCLALMRLQSDAICEALFKPCRIDQDFGAVIQTLKRDKKERRFHMNQLKAECIKAHESTYSPWMIKHCLEIAETEVLSEILKRHNVRVDGRHPEDVRSVSGEIHFLPTPHGSALFTRGETQVLTTLTIGKPEEKLSVEKLSGFESRTLIFHYNFPSYSVGEIDRSGAPSRREIGHGNVAYRAILAVIPEDFAYTLRLVSEVLASNGSSSMASVCGASMALMQAGVPIKTHVAGIALGCTKQGCVLVDILGDEDHLGDMDLKVAGTKKGFTAIQMDLKTNGITPVVLQKALNQGKKAIQTILATMDQVIAKPAEALPASLPVIEVMYISPRKIKFLIGKSGATIREISDQTHCRVDVNDMGRVVITSSQRENIFAAKRKIRATVEEPDPNAVYDGVVREKHKDRVVIAFHDYLSGYIKDKRQLKVGEAVKIKLHHVDERGDIVVDVVTDGLPL